MPLGARLAVNTHNMVWCFVESGSNANPNANPRYAGKIPAYRGLACRENRCVKRLRQIGAEMVQDSKATTLGGVAGCKMKAQCKGGVIAGSRISSLMVAAGERRGSLGVGFENMMRSWVMKYGAQGLGVVASRWLWGGKAKQGARKGSGMRGHRLLSPPCFV